MTTAPPSSTTRQIASRLFDQAQHRFGATAVRSVLGLADQAVVSGSRFVATIMIGRLCGADQLGLYGLGFSFVVLFACIQEALITLPYTALARRVKYRRAEYYAGSVLLLSLVMSTIATIGLAVCTNVLSTLPSWTLQARALGMLVFCLPPILLWEFGRRIGFAHQRVGAVFALDAVTAVCWLGSFAVLGATGYLSAQTAYFAMGMSYGVVTIAWLVRYGQRFRISVRATRQRLQEHWTFGRWILGSETLSMARSYIGSWLVAGILGVHDTGVFIAYLTIVVLANPILNGISNVLAPDMAHAFTDEGIDALKRVVTKATIALGSVMLLLAGVLAALGEPLITTLYGADFAGQHMCVFILAIGLVAEAVGMPSYNGLWAMHRPNLCFVACLFGLVATVALTIASSSTLGLVGAAIGFTAGKFVAAIVQGIAFWWSARNVDVEGAEL